MKNSTQTIHLQDSHDRCIAADDAVNDTKEQMGSFVSQTMTNGLKIASREETDLLTKLTNQESALTEHLYRTRRSCTKCVKYQQLLDLDLEFRQVNSWRYGVSPLLLT